VTYTIRRIVVDAVKLQGASMEPTLSAEDDVVLCEKITSCQDLKVGDIVIFQSPTHPGVLYCKRVVGLTGTPYSIATPTPFGLVTSERRIPQGHIWVEGDNKPKSVDSRVFGPIPAGLVEGRVCARIWPPERMQWIEKRSEHVPPYPLLCLHPALAERVRLKGMPPPSPPPSPHDLFHPGAVFRFLTLDDHEAAPPKLGDVVFSPSSPLRGSPNPIDETNEFFDAVRHMIEAPPVSDRPFSVAPMSFKLLLNPFHIFNPPPEEIGSPSPSIPHELMESPPVGASPHSISLPVPMKYDDADEYKVGLDAYDLQDSVHRHVSELDPGKIEALISAVLDAKPPHDWSFKPGAPRSAIPDVDKLPIENLFDPAASFSSGSMIKRARDHVSLDHPNTPETEKQDTTGSSSSSNGR